MNDILITAECVADIPNDICKNYGIDIIYYDIKTESGIFRDTEEIDSQNVMEYMSDGKKMAYSIIPTTKDYENFFAKRLNEYREVIHICISSGISEAYNNAVSAKEHLGEEGKRIHIIDSQSLSSGQGLLAMEAIKYRKSGMNCMEIVNRLEEVIPNISTSFLANNADYLYYNGKVKKSVKEICKFFHIHPILQIRKGKLTVKKVVIGNYNRAIRRYIMSALRNEKQIDPSVGFITYAGCDEDILEKVREKVNARISFEKLYEQQASATVSSNCGPKTFGILFIRKGEIA